MSVADAPAFDVCGPLPTGVTVLEASAGTGKTFAIAALAVRYVAEGTPLERLLLVTFTRMATGELRDRVRERLVRVEQELERAQGGARSDDELVRLLCTGTPDEVAERRGRLVRAVAGFDAATITTTHGFCQEVLGGLGVAGDVDPRATFVEDVSDLVAEVVADLYVRRFHAGGEPPFGPDQAMRIARVAVSNPAARIEPAGDGAGEDAAMRRRFAAAVCRELDARKRRSGVMTYDDLLTRLEATLASDPAAAARLGARFEVVLVDEFQDTDPVQWRILERAFGRGGSTLVLIGDPKQAIYAFRGADVYAYLDAARSAGTRRTLDRNWRSDQGLIDAYGALLGGARLGHPGIVHRTVRAADPDAAPRLAGTPLRFRVVQRQDVGTTAHGYARAGPAREHVAEDLAADIVRRLSGRDAVEPGDLAVLVRTNANAALIRDALRRAGVPAVVNGAGSVFATAPARDWLRLLEALERPTQDSRARAAALTPFFGWTAADVAAASDGAWEAVHQRLHDWARMLSARGVAALAETITLAEGLPRRLLTTVDGERALTDLRHVAQLLHAAAATEHLGATALTAWLRRRVAEAGQDTGDEERSRRLESDEEAVQVLTIHRSKGLEFPVVYCPYLWEPGPVPRDDEPVAFHDPHAGDARAIDVGLEGAAYRAHRDQHIVEQRGEDLRLAYVALTRARHQAVVWWAGSFDSRNSPLSRLLFCTDPDGNVPAFGSRVPSDAEATRSLQALAADATGSIAVERSVLSALPAEWSEPMPRPADLAAARFDRRLDLGWRRTSYSDMTAGAHEARVASEPEEAVVTDEPPAATAPPAVPVFEAEPALPSPLAGMPVGVQVGTAVHRLLEATDFAAADLDAELRTRLREVQARRPADLGDPEAVVAGLRAAVETPLGPLLGGVRLRDIARSDRLDELEFELPLAGGDDPTGRVGVSAIAAVLREHLAPEDPLAPYAARLGDPALRQSVRGYLTGSLDLVARLPDGRFAVLDYKTNRLAAPGEELTVAHHRPEALAAEMLRAHYGLQALLYTAALHRYLRWRLPGYDPAAHLAGVGYLFLRGMAGAATPAPGGTPYGVFAWRPPAPFVEALSDALG